MTSPIGIFDSGLGGLSVAKEILRTLPRERIIYFADNAHVPYGERPFEEVREFACGITDFLVNQGAKAVVMACNMSSAIALESARQRHPDIPVLGVIEPGTRAALKVSNGSPIGVLATTGTVKSQAYINSLKRLDVNSIVFQQACPKFVPLVESGETDSEEAESVARRYTSSILDSGCRTVILGCTHYPFLAKAIRAAVGKDVIIVDPAVETVIELTSILSSSNQLSEQLVSNHAYYTSGETQSFSELGAMFLDLDSLLVRQASWNESSLVRNP